MYVALSPFTTTSFIVVSSGNPSITNVCSFMLPSSAFTLIATSVCFAVMSICFDISYSA